MVFPDISAGVPKEKQDGLFLSKDTGDSLAVAWCSSLLVAVGAVCVSGVFIHPKATCIATRSYLLQVAIEAAYLCYAGILRRDPVFIATGRAGTIIVVFY